MRDQQIGAEPCLRGLQFLKSACKFCNYPSGYGRYREQPGRGGYEWNMRGQVSDD